MLSHVRTLETIMTVANKVSLPMRFSKQKYSSGFPCPPPGDIHDLGIELQSFVNLALPSEFFTTSVTMQIVPL